jgi:hypothetical protein
VVRGAGRVARDVGQWPDAYGRKAVQAVGARVRRGPWGCLESRTRMWAGAGATSTQSGPSDVL